MEIIFLCYRLVASLHGEGNGSPLQCSCLENPREGGACGLPSMGLHRVRHDWRDLAAVAAASLQHPLLMMTNILPGAKVNMWTGFSFIVTKQGKEMHSELKENNWLLAHQVKYLIGFCIYFSPFICLKA